MVNLGKKLSLIHFPLNERGASAVEYALLLALIAIVCVATLVHLGRATGDQFQIVSNNLTPPGGGGDDSPGGGGSSPGGGGDDSPGGGGSSPGGGGGDSPGGGGSSGSPESFASSSDQSSMKGSAHTYQGDLHGLTRSQNNTGSRISGKNSSADLSGELSVASSETPPSENTTGSSHSQLFIILFLLAIIAVIGFLYMKRRSE